MPQSDSDSSSSFSSASSCSPAGSTSSRSTSAPSPSGSGGWRRKPKGPGLVLIFWPFETMVKVSMQTIVHDVPPQDIITRDNVSVKVNAIVYFRVVDPATRDRRGAELPLGHQPARPDDAAFGARPGGSGRSALRARQAQRQAPGDHRPAHRSLGHQGVDGGGQERRPAPEMQRAMARQAEAEREKRAKIIHAEGELEASVKLAEAARDHLAKPGDLATALPADADRDLGGEELDHHLPVPDRSPQGLHQRTRRPELEPKCLNRTSPAITRSP